MKFAVIKTGGKQYEVTPGQVIEVEKLEAAPAERVNFSEVLLLGDRDEGAVKDLKIGKPTVTGATVTAEVLVQDRQPKVVVVHFKAKTRHRKKAGHRQPFTKVKILEIAG